MLSVWLKAASSLISHGTGGSLGDLCSNYVYSNWASLTCPIISQVYTLTSDNLTGLSWTKDDDTISGECGSLYQQEQNTLPTLSLLPDPGTIGETGGAPRFYQISPQYKDTRLHVLL